MSINSAISMSKGYGRSSSTSKSSRLCDYQIALRERLKLIKYLKREDWHYIGVQFSLRKGQGKGTEVVWNNRPMAPEKVRKEVRRNRQYLPRRSHVHHDKCISVSLWSSNSSKALTLKYSFSNTAGSSDFENTSRISNGSCGLDTFIAICCIGQRGGKTTLRWNF